MTFTLLLFFGVYFTKSFRYNWYMKPFQTLSSRLYVCLNRHTYCTYLVTLSLQGRNFCRRDLHSVRACVCVCTAKIMFDISERKATCRRHWMTQQIGTSGEPGQWTQNRRWPLPSNMSTHFTHFGDFSWGRHAAVLSSTYCEISKEMSSLYFRLEPGSREVG